MPERSAVAIVLSAAAHGLFVAAAALIPFRARGAAKPGVVEGTGHDRDAIEAGLLGNTVEVDRFVDGALGGGTKTGADDNPKPEPAADPQPVEPRPATPPKPAQRTEPKTVAAPSPAPKTERRRKKRRRRRAAAPSSGSSAAAKPGSNPSGQGEATGGDGTDEGEGRRHGTAEARNDVVSVAGSFAHAIPMAFSANKMWHELDLGVVAASTVTIVVEDGKVKHAEFAKKTPKLIRKIVNGVIIMIRARKTRLSLSDDASGTERLAITVTVSERELTAKEKELAANQPVLQMSHVKPTAKKPGNGNFTFASGRHIEVKVAVVD